MFVLKFGGKTSVVDMCLCKKSSSGRLVQPIVGRSKGFKWKNHTGIVA